MLWWDCSEARTRLGIRLVGMLNYYNKLVTLDVTIFEHNKWTSPWNSYRMCVRSYAQLSICFTDLKALAILRGYTCCSPMRYLHVQKLQLFTCLLAIPRFQDTYSDAGWVLFSLEIFVWIVEEWLNVCAMHVYAKCHYTSLKRVCTNAHSS